MCGLGDVSGMDQVVVRVAELVVTLLQACQKVVQRLRTYLSKFVYRRDKSLL